MVCWQSSLARVGVIRSAEGRELHGPPERSVGRKRQNAQRSGRRSLWQDVADRCSFYCVYEANNA